VNDLFDPLADSTPPLEVDIRALTSRTTADPDPVPSRWPAVALRVAVAALVGAVAGVGLWWHRTVTADPGLEFTSGPNAYRDTAFTDYSGITRNRNLLGEEIDVAFVPAGHLYVTFGLYNGGPHDVRIEGAPPQKMYYWAFDRMSVAHDPAAGFAGFDRRYQPFRPFTLHRGETADVRLEFRLADCDPATLQPGQSYIRDLPVRYRTFGATRTAQVPLRDAAVALEASGKCLHPITDHN